MRETKFFVILGHFLPFQPHDNLENQNLKIESNTSWYYHFTNLHHKWQSYHVLPPYGPRKLKFWKNEKNTWWHYHFPNVNFTKMKETPGDIIILHKCTKNHDHMLYCSWDMARDGCTCYFSFWAIFCPFAPLTIQKIKIS